MALQDLISKTIPLVPKHGSDRYLVPRDGEPSSLVVDTVLQRWYHNASGRWGGPYTWARDMSHIDPREFIGSGDAQPISEPRVTIDPCLGKKYHRQLNKRAITYLHERGISDETIARFELGYKPGHISIPYYRDGILTGIKLRRLNTDEHGLKYVAVKGSVCGLFHHGSVLVEGEFKAMTLCQDGIESCSAPAGMMVASRAGLFTDVRFYVRDNDAAGFAAAARAVRIIPQLVVLSVPGNVKSVDDLKLRDTKEYERWIAWMRKLLKSRGSQQS